MQSLNLNIPKLQNLSSSKPHNKFMLILSLVTCMCTCTSHFTFQEKLYVALSFWICSTSYQQITEPSDSDSLAERTLANTTTRSETPFWSRNKGASLWGHLQRAFLNLKFLTNPKNRTKARLEISLDSKRKAMETETSLKTSRTDVHLWKSSSKSSHPKNLKPQPRYLPETARASKSCGSRRAWGNLQPLWREKKIHSYSSTMFWMASSFLGRNQSSLASIVFRLLWNCRRSYQARLSWPRKINQTIAFPSLIILTVMSKAWNLICSTARKL
jgi:hypothetical protein